MEVVSRPRIQFGSNAEFHIETHIPDTSFSVNVELEAGTYLIYCFFGAWGSNGEILGGTAGDVYCGSKKIDNCDDAPKCISLTKKTVVTFKASDSGNRKDHLWIYFYKQID